MGSSHRLSVMREVNGAGLQFVLRIRMASAWSRKNKSKISVTLNGHDGVGCLSFRARERHQTRSKRDRHDLISRRNWYPLSAQWNRAGTSYPQERTSSQMEGEMNGNVTRIFQDHSGWADSFRKVAVPREGRRRAFANPWSVVRHAYEHLALHVLGVPSWPKRRALQR